MDEVAMSTLDHVRELIHAEVGRANPVAESRRALELIVETSLRYGEQDGELRVTVIDDEGRRRTRMQGDREVDLTIADLVAELRAKHPALFGSSRPTVGEPSRGVAMAPTGAERTAADARLENSPANPRDTAAAEPRTPVRDVLSLGSVADDETLLAPAGAGGPRPVEQAAQGRSWTSRWAAFTKAGRDRIRVRAGSRPLTAAFGAVHRGLARLRPPQSASRVVPGQRGTGFGLRTHGLSGRVALTVLAVALSIPLLGLLATSLINDSGARRSPEVRAAASRPAEPETTGTIQGQDPSPAPTGPIRGVAEVLDTATLSVQGKVIRLFGVEWAKGAGDPDDLAGYLKGREVVCRPEGATDKHRCDVQGQDLSKVVLFNGGGRATAEASPDLKAAEEHARSQQIGVWGSESLKARP
jgi:endonuclease YncB( thermonuclease family)